MNGFRCHLTQIKSREWFVFRCCVLFILCHLKYWLWLRVVDSILVIVIKCRVCFHLYRMLQPPTIWVYQSVIISRERFKKKRRIYCGAPLPFSCLLTYVYPVLFFCNWNPTTYVKHILLGPNEKYHCKVFFCLCVFSYVTYFRFFVFLYL